MILRLSNSSRSVAVNSFPAWSRRLLGVGAMFASLGCVDQSRTILEAPARLTMLVPVCSTQLAPPGRSPSSKAKRVPLVRSLDPEHWLEVMVPELARAANSEPVKVEEAGSKAENKSLRGDSIDCTGHYVFANETLRFGVSSRGWPRLVDADEIDQRSGPKGTSALRLRAVRFENGDVGGPIALVRAVDDRAEIYGMGSYRGPEGAKLTPVRMGNEMIVTAEAKRCPDIYNCRRTLDFFLLRNGRLLNAATIDLERVLRVPSVTERGLFAEYRMTTDVSYGRGGIQLLEQVKVKIIKYENQGDRDSDRLLRTVEFSRRLQVERDALFSTNESVWERVIGRD